MEDELGLAKKRLSHEMINNRLLSDEITNLQRQTMHLFSTNEVLIKSNKRYEEKWQKIFYTLEFYREFYHKYIDLITKGRAHMKSASIAMPKFDNLVKLREKFDVDLDESPEKLIRGLKRIDEENGKQINLSILEANEAENSVGGGDADNMENLNEVSKERCKIFLLNMAKDLYVNTNLSKNVIAKQMLKKLTSKDEYPQSTMKLKRSLSNPLEYVSERKRFIFENATNKKDKKGQKGKEKKDQKFMEEHSDQFLNTEEKMEVSPLDKDFLGKDQGGSHLDPQRMNKKPKGVEHEGGEISFTVDAEEFNKNKLVEVSFISNNDILDHIKQD